MFMDARTASLVKKPRAYPQGENCTTKEL